MQMLETNDMPADHIISELRRFIITRFAVPTNDCDFTNTIDLFNYGYIDSLGAAALTTFIEDRFGLKFTNADWVTYPLSSIEEIAIFISKRTLGEI